MVLFLTLQVQQYMWLWWVHYHRPLMYKIFHELNLSPAKQLSHELKTGLGRLVNRPQDQDQLQQALINIWNTTPQVCLANYSIKSVRRGVTA